MNIVKRFNYDAVNEGSDMRINELKGYRDDPVYKIFQQAPDIDDFADELARKGYRLQSLGDGLYSQVFAKPGGKYVYKLFTVKDTGYLEYLKYAMANQYNPHVPRIFGKPIKIEMPGNRDHTHGQQFLIVKLERLKEYYNGNPTPDINVIMDVMDWLHDSKTKKTMSRKQHDLAQSVKKNYPDLFKILEWLYELQRATGKNPDLHTGNVMLRGNTVVITDPLTEL